jgi:NTE family protein
MNGVGPSKTAMVLSGGGAHGAYEAGVMLALFRGECPATGGQPLEVDQFAGTSVGAYNAAAMIAGAGQGFAESAWRLTQIWLNEIARQEDGCENGIFRVRTSDFLTLSARCLLRPAAVGNAIKDGGFFLRTFVPRLERFARVAWPVSSDSLTRASLEQLEVSALLDMRPFDDLLRRTVPLDSLRTSGLKLKAVASNFDTGKVSVFTDKDIIDRVGHAAIRASAAIPGFFPPVVVDGAVHVDGGALMNTPLVPAARGSDTVHVVYLDPSVASLRIENLQSTLGVIDRMFLMTFAFSMNEDIELIRAFNQSLDLADTLDPAAESDPRIRALDAAESAISQWVRVNGEFGPTTIHRYHPTDDLGGALGFLDFSRQQVQDLIDRGYSDAVGHDCVASGCLLPGRKEGA